jgi:hypothetical protein
VAGGALGTGAEGMKRVNRIADSTTGELRQTYDRSVQIIRLIATTKSPDPRIEWSALATAAALCMATSSGIEASNDNLSEIIELLASEVNPAVEKLVREMKARL